MILIYDFQSRVSSFKARPATVIHQKPFVPVLPKHETVFPLGFHLKTEERAIQRSKFDEKIKEKEEALATILKKVSHLFFIVLN